MRLGGETGDDFFYHKNHQGSITEITDINGNIAKMYKYDAFGKKYFESGPPLVDEFAYTARQLHDRTGLYYYRNRFYNPQLGRFMTQDPIGITGGTNLYTYVGNSPVNYVDPLGLWQLVPGAYGDYSYAPGERALLLNADSIQLAETGYGGMVAGKGLMVVGAVTTYKGRPEGGTTLMTMGAVVYATGLHDLVAASQGKGIDDGIVVDTIKNAIEGLPRGHIGNIPPDQLQEAMKNLEEGLHKTTNCP